MEVVYHLCYFQKDIAQLLAQNDGYGVLKILSIMEFVFSAYTYRVTWTITKIFLDFDQLGYNYISFVLFHIAYNEASMISAKPSALK